MSHFFSEVEKKSKLDFSHKNSYQLEGERNAKGESYKERPQDPQKNCTKVVGSILTSRDNHEGKKW